MKDLAFTIPFLGTALLRTIAIGNSVLVLESYRLCVARWEYIDSRLALILCKNEDDIVVTLPGASSIQCIRKKRHQTGASTVYPQQTLPAGPFIDSMPTESFPLAAYQGVPVRAVHVATMCIYYLRTGDSAYCSWPIAIAESRTNVYPGTYLPRYLRTAMCTSIMRNMPNDKSITQRTRMR